MATIPVKDANGNTVTAALVESTGQKAMANSLPVVLADDQSAIPISSQALTNLDTDIGQLTVTAAPSDGTGDYSVIAALKRGLLNGAAILARIPALVSGRIPTVDASRFRPAFNNDCVWHGYNGFGHYRRWCCRRCSSRS